MIRRSLVAAALAAALVAALLAVGAASAKKPGSASVEVIPQVALTTAPNQHAILYTNGPLTITAFCFISLAPTTSIFDADIDVTTTVDHVAAYGGEGGNPDFGPSVGIGLLDARVTFPTFTTPGSAFKSTSFSVIAPDGTAFSGTLYAGLKVLGGTGCVFVGFVTAAP
jgi:hypothetical protein